jgi:hypothetical protein
VEYNRGPRKQYPQIGASISRTTAAAMANLIAVAAKTGLMTISDADEDSFREYAELPPRSVDRPKPGEVVPGAGDPNAPPATDLPPANPQQQQRARERALQAGAGD